MSFRNDVGMTTCITHDQITLQAIARVLKIISIITVMIIIHVIIKHNQERSPSSI